MNAANQDFIVRHCFQYKRAASLLDVVLSGRAVSPQAEGGGCYNPTCHVILVGLFRVHRRNMVLTLKFGL
jgi:hypothetical protein